MHFNNRTIIDDIETCQDLLDMKWSQEELYSDVRGGILPIGTLIVSPDGNYHMVSLSGTKYYLRRVNFSIGNKQENNEHTTN